MNKNKLIIYIVAVLVLILGTMYLVSVNKEKAIQKEEINNLNQATNLETNEAIDSSINEIDIDSGVDGDIQSIDKELKVL